jgi:hypothetical protein
MKRLLILGLLFAGSAHAQTIQVAGGASTLFGAEGGSVTLYTADTNSTFGVGVSNGRLVAGANSEFLFHGWGTTVGDKQIFLATQQLGLSTVMRGVEAQRKSDTHTLSVFVGAVGQSYSAPFFSGMTAKEFGAGVNYARKFSHFDLSTVEALTGGKATALEGVVFHWRGLNLQGTAGVLESKKYLIGQGTWRLQHASFDAGRQTLVWNGERSTVVSASASAWAGPMDGHASLFRSQRAAGENAGIGLHVGALTLRGDSFWSRQQHTLTASAMERLARRWTVSEYVTRSGGRTSVNFGGSFTSNLVAASFGYQQEFIPFGRVPFQKVLSITLAFQLPHGTSLNLATVASPTGGTRWTAYGGSYVQAPWIPSARAQGAHHGHIGGFEVRGTVKDKYGMPVFGAVVVINGSSVYTDTQGVFSMRLRKNASVTVLIEPEQFITPGTWSVVSAPDIAKPGTDLQIVVERKVGK